VKGIDRVDLWVGGLAEKHINGGMVGQTFWVVLHEQFDRLQEADRFYYKDRLEAFDFYEAFIDGQEFSDIIVRNTGLTNLPEHIFEVDDEDDGIGDSDVDDDVIGGEDDDVGGPGDDDDIGSGDDDAPACGEDDNGPGTDDGTVPPPPPSPSVTGVTRSGTADADVLSGAAGADTLLGLGGNDALIGGEGADVLTGGDGNDFLSGEAGRDMLFGGDGDDHLLGGDGADMLYGDAGHDRILAGAGDDLIDVGSGHDTVFGGAGDDRLVASMGDGNDTYYGDEMDGGSGIDTLDMAAISANITADLGTGLMGRGSVVSAESGADTLWGVENIVTGSGDDVITASRAVNVIDGGAGNDTFRFLSAQDADGDTLVSFQPGDRIDLSAIDANTGIAGNGTFTLVSGAFTGAGQLMVSHESRADGDYTLVQGNTSGGADADFTLEIKGTHDLTGSNFTL
jgi:Ca2+-binding RTX toxin-like protein